VEIAAAQEGAMTDESLAKRLEMLEKRMAEIQRLQSAVDALSEQVSQVLQSQDAMKLQLSAMRNELLDLIRDVDEENRRYMRVLYEDALARIAASTG
jgi:uncharacterized coiled-coil protein SlyX